MASPSEFNTLTDIDSDCDCSEDERYRRNKRNVNKRISYKQGSYHYDGTSDEELHSIFNKKFEKKINPEIYEIYAKNIIGKVASNLREPISVTKIEASNDILGMIKIF